MSKRTDGQKQLRDYPLETLRDELKAREAKDKQGAGTVMTHPELASFETASIIKTVREQQKVIYGVDDRQDLYQVNDAAILGDADSVVALFSANSVTDNGNGTSTLTTENFGTSQNLCGTEPFRDQPIGAFCSGFLVAPDVIATAGHCVNASSVTTVRFVFGYRMQDATQARTVITNTEIYQGVTLIDRQQASNGADWALVRLDRPVTNHRVVHLRLSGKIDDAQGVHVIGHPVGLPIKVAGGAAVRSNTQAAFFVANLDTYGGNSGSPVFNSQTHEVEGILVRGETDFASNGSCNISLVCPSTGCRGEDCTRTTEFAAKIPLDIKPVPGWFGWEDQGADIAVADLNHSGRPDLLVFHIDNPGGENHGYYRVGWDLSATGNVTGGWSSIKPVPGWFGDEDQGAGIAMADINRNGQSDLVIFHIDNPEGENHGYYRIGWDLDANGDVTGGWSPIKPVPGWFGWEDQGAAIAVADVSRNGQSDLVVFHLDNPEGENHGYYRIGWNLDANGDVTGGWSPVKPVPDWFGWENQGAGIAIGDVNGDGWLDLVVFHLDNPEGENHGYYRIGYRLDANGDVTGGWSPIKPVPGWFGWEDQGAGIALARINDTPQDDLVIFHVDNPGGENHGYYRTVWDL
ncbi:trypsin-like peptidase domain-containing protein [Corallococcus exiguus]|uniref:trypsin-like peptidase domain-containing protein n=1 Tax=Corallococcus exiguus TaxID=83462 RepID=UPI001494892F|nr:trypsin-like peptidase domain-containing protein [Corallococcus exiguus]NPD21912.1 trypsin-like serine protease [Corallococcus exiguus]NRD47294.1 trypsin-like peptidase domain-containing protein [Corallococcus exiguus]